MKYPNIEAERARAGITASKLSNNIAVSRNTYRSWQLGISEIPANKLCAMADIFGVSTDYLLGRDKR